jgi:hypothetical protein
MDFLFAFLDIFGFFSSSDAFGARSQGSDPSMGIGPIGMGIGPIG